MNELKPCRIEAALAWVSNGMWPQDTETTLMLHTIKTALLRAAPSNEPLCAKNENFIQNKFGYCFYSLGPFPLIYNLYVHPQYRRCGHSETLLHLAIEAIRKRGREGKIYVQAYPRENSIARADLVRYYKSAGLTILEVHKPEWSENG